MNQNLKTKIRVTAVLLVTLGTQSAERTLSLEVYDPNNNDRIEKKACSKYTSIIHMGGNVTVKRIFQ